MIKIKRGLSLPISGQPEQVISDGPKVRTVAVLGGDYVGMRPTMHVQVGDHVQKGQLLFVDKKTEGVKYTAPASGTISAIHRGHKRVLLSVVIDVEGDDEITFSQYQPSELSNLARDKVVDQLAESGLWTSFRTRPFSKVPATNTSCHSIFVNAMDTNPLSADPEIIIKEKADAFAQGLQVISNLTEGTVYLCTGEGADVPDGGVAKTETFAGPHPAGLAGTHIHFLDPVSESKTVWTIGYQDVIAIGTLFTTGKIDSSRVVSLAGPQVEKPRLVRTQVGASVDEICAGNIRSGENRVISGSVLSGIHAHGPIAFMGRYHNQVSVILEGRDRGFLEYLSPGLRKHSVARIYLSKILPTPLLDMTTSTNGSERAIVPIGSYEKVMPLDILPTYLLRALVVGDTEMASELGCLELDEEDLALCTYVCPGKYEYGSILRDNLTTIEREG